MDKRKQPHTREHNLKIGLSHKGIHLNKTNSGVLVYKDGKKLCAVCNEWKLLSEYDKRPERPIGVKPKCKACTRVYRATMPEMVKFAQYKSGARKRGIAFNLTKEEFMSLWNKPCFYCGTEIATIGIDRIDSNLCYCIGNIVPCCSICNTMKLALPRNVFVTHCAKVAKHSAIVPD